MGYWTEYGKLNGGRPMEFDYLTPQPHGGALKQRRHRRRVLVMGPVQRSAKGRHFIRAIDTDQDAPRSFRVDKIRNARAA